MKKFCTLTTVLLISACQSSPKRESAPEPQDFGGIIISQVTQIGVNEQPSFSPSGDRIIYSSKLRPEHQRSQLYEYDFFKGTSRRITFQDGETAFPIYVSSDEILYSSTTDEIKESPFLKELSDKLPPFTYEIYKSDIFGNQIERLTQFPGFDGEAQWYSGPNSFILFSSIRGEIRGLYTLSLPGKGLKILSVAKGKERTSPVFLSKAGEYFFIEKDLEKQTTSLVGILRRNGKEVFRSSPGDIRSLRATADGKKIYYSIKRDNEKFFRLELHDPSQHCTQVLLSGPADLYEPHIAPSGTGKIAFAKEDSKGKHIYTAEVPGELGPCLEAQSQSK